MFHEFVIDNIKNFNLIHTFDCGQCFRWKPNPDGSYSGGVGDGIFNLKMEGKHLWVKTNRPNSKELLEQYLDSKTDYSAIKKSISQNDVIMEKAVKFGYGIRILKQDHWETLVSFIVSANNNIPRIMKIVESICKMYGKPIEFMGNVYYTFPSPEEIVEKGEHCLDQCGLGFRCKYIKHAARMVLSGEVDLGCIEKLDSHKGRIELMKINGVGPKVADCVLLYSYARTDVFPTDVWIKRIVETLYFGEEKTIDKIHQFAKETFGDLAGYAQQYLFYYARGKGS